MDVKDLERTWKFGKTYDVVRLPFHAEHPVRFVETAQFVAVDGVLTGENECEVWAETTTGRKETLWKGAVIGSLGNMVSHFASMIGLGK